MKIFLLCGCPGLEPSMSRDVEKCVIKIFKTHIRLHKPQKPHANCKNKTLNKLFFLTTTSHRVY